MTRKKSSAVQLDDEALEQATGGYYELHFKDGTSKKINADGSEYKTLNDFYGTLYLNPQKLYDCYNSWHNQQHKLEGIATFKEI